MRTGNLLAGAFAALLLAGAGYLWHVSGGPQVAPNFTVRTLDGETIRLAELQGRPVLVTFWATTCEGCVKEMPQLTDLYRELAPEGLEIIAVAMSYDPPDRVVRMRESRNIPYPVALDIRGKISQAFGDVRGTPTSYLIGPDGRIATRKAGEIDMARLREEILGMVKSKG